jgi:hypothetical protein
MAKVNKQFVMQQQMNAYKAKFKHPFTISDVVDIEEMGANYPNELVPVVDIAEGVKILIQNKIATPVGGKYNSYAINCFSGELVPASSVYTHWMFQRNTYCNNVANIVINWFEPCARSGKGVRLPAKYGSIVLPADSGHTSVARIIRGETMLPFEIADVPDQGNFADTLQLAMEIAGEIFLSLNSKNVKKPSKFDIYRIAVVQQQSPEVDIHNVVDPLGFKVKQGATSEMSIHNLNDIHFLWNLDKTGTALETAMRWWKRNWKDETVDPCLSAAFGLLMHRERERKNKWSVADQDKLAAELKSKFNIIEMADDFIKEAFAEVTWDNVAKMQTITLDHNNQVMLGLAYMWNKMNPKSGILIPAGVDFSKATSRVL